MCAALTEADVATLAIAASLLPAHTLVLSRREQQLITVAHRRWRWDGRMAAIRPAARDRLTRAASRLCAAELRP